MKKTTFNPKDWLDKKKSGQSLPPINNTVHQKNDRSPVSLIEMELLLSQLEEVKVDITKEYADWRNIGFAFADEFGEEGRELFHRVSRFYPGYSADECDKQFNSCLKSNGSGVTMATFFYKLKQAGLNAIPARQDIESNSQNLPVFPDKLFSKLPGILQKATSQSSENFEKDILLLGALTSISSCLPNIHGIYDELTVYPNLYLFVTAKAAAGKGRLKLCRLLVEPIHLQLREESQREREKFNEEMAEYKAAKKSKNPVPKPEPPVDKMLFIPANNSSSGFFQILFDCNGEGLIFETEGDTLSLAFKAEYGNYSDGFRKAFQHETISLYRRTNREYLDIPSPRLSAVLSGTPGQVSALIPDAENGLFSRFIFYHINSRPVWKNVFSENNGTSLEEYFKTLGDEYYTWFLKLKKADKKIQIAFTKIQQKKFNKYFAGIQEKYYRLYGSDYIASIRRLGLIAFRIALIITALRIENIEDTSSPVTCSDSDFDVVLSIINVLVQHAAKTFSDMPRGSGKRKHNTRKEKFLEQLPLHFNRQKYLEVAKSLSIPDKTAEGYITEFVKKGLIHRESHDQYVNSTLENESNSCENNN